MKRITAIMIAVMIIIQLVPALGTTYSSGTIVGSPKGFKEPMEIVASKGTYVLLGQTLELDVNEDYIAIWKSGDENIAAIDAKGILTAVAPGTVTVTAESGRFTATVEITVLDPAPLMEAAAADVQIESESETENEPEDEPTVEVKPEAEPVAEGEPEGKAEPLAEVEPEAESEPKDKAEPEGEPEPESELEEGEPEGREGQEAEAENEAAPEKEPNQTAQQPAQQAQPEKPVEKKLMVIVINGENDRVVYDGEEHTLDRFVATGNDDSFDPEKVTHTGDLGVTGKDCGIYELNMDNIQFGYDDPNVIPTFVVNNSYMRITPAQVTVTADSASKQEGEPEPELTATVVGLYGEDSIEYTLTREAGEGVGEYIITVAGEEQQGNYRINYVSGKFAIEGTPTVIIESSIPEGQVVYLGTEVTLKAVTAGFGDAELTYQWQWTTDGENWNDIIGETRRVYTFYIDEENYDWTIRVTVNPKD